MHARNTTATARHSASGSQPRKAAVGRESQSSKPTAELLEKQLRQITGKALDALKNPAAIPSNVILAALKSARQI